MLFTGETPCANYRGPSEQVTRLANAAWQDDLDYIKEHLPGPSGVIDPESLYHTLTFATLGVKVAVIQYLLDVYPPSKWQQVSTSYNMGSGQLESLYPLSLADDLFQADDASVMRTYLDSGLSPNWKFSEDSGSDQDESDSLMYICACNHNLLTVLVQYGGDVHLGVDGLRTPLCRAAESNAVDCMRLLLDHGAAFGHALWCAARKGRVEAARLLLDRGADINSHNTFTFDEAPDFLQLPEDGNERDFGVALHAAIIVKQTSVEDFEGASFDMAEFLLNNNASLEEKDYLGKTPYDYAQKCENCCWSKEQIELFKPKTAQAYSHELSRS